MCVEAVLSQHLHQGMKLGQQAISAFFILSGETAYAVHKLLTSRKYEIINEY